MSISLYRKYRPQDFASVVGQKAAVDVLTSSITKNRVGHAYLFSGSRGCGKTSIARIFAKALNCTNRQDYEPCGKCANCEAITAGESLDVIEIDGASNNGVENIRGLRENVTLSPFSSKYKVYIIDEVHMLSQGAFNALLKTLEEPPEYVVFILATTEPHKVPVTIRSRCQHIPFHSISPEDIYSRLNFVCESEGVKADSDALYELARQADGALRDGLSLLEQVIAAGDVTLANVEAVCGAGSRPAFERWLRALRTNPEDAYTAVKAMFDAGASGVRVFEEMFSLVRNVWLASKWKGITDTLGLSSSEKKFISEEVNNWKPDNLHALLSKILRALTQARLGTRPDILLGMFTLSLEAEPAPQAAAVVATQAPEVPAAPPPAEPAKPKPAGPLVYDEALKAELLTAAHDSDFVIYCALFDVRAGRQNGTLVLDVEHPYCYDRLRLDVNSSKLAEIFGNYGKVILRYRMEETVCERIEHVKIPGTESKTPAPAPKPAPVHIDLPEPTKLEPASEPVPAPKQEQPATASHSYAPSVLDKYRNEFARWGASPEVLLTKRIEPEESTSNDEELQLEGDNDE